MARHDILEEFTVEVDGKAIECLALEDYGADNGFYIVARGKNEAGEEEWIEPTYKGWPELCEALEGYSPKGW